MSLTAVAIVAADASGRVIPGAIAYLSSPAVLGGFLFAITNEKGYAVWKTVPVPFSGVLQLAGAAAPYGSMPDHGGEPVTIPDGQNITIRVGPTPASPQDVQLPPASFHKPVIAGPAIHGRLTSVGPRLHDDRGPWKWKMATAFDALHLVCLGDIDRVRTYGRWVTSISGNGLRVFCNWAVAGLDFRLVPGYFHKVRTLCALTQEEGLRLECCAVCDYIPPTVTEQQDFIEQLAAVLAEFDHATLVFGNEPYQNMANPELIDEPNLPLLMARGMCNPYDGSLPYLPSAGFTVYQTVRSDDWMRKVGKDGYEIHHGFEGFQGTHDATINTEMMGAAETYQPGRRSNRPDEFFMAGIAAAMFTSGATAHGDTETMQKCRVPGPIEAECARQLFRGIDLVPLDAPTWMYCRYGLNESSVPVEPDAIDVANGTDIRIHAMVGPTQAVSINYHYLEPGHDAWKPLGINGWRTVNQDGPYVLSER